MLHEQFTTTVQVCKQIFRSIVKIVSEGGNKERGQRMSGNFFIYENG